MTRLYNVKAIDRAEPAEENPVRQRDVVVPVIGDEAARDGQVGVVDVVSWVVCMGCFPFRADYPIGASIARR